MSSTNPTTSNLSYDESSIFSGFEILIQNIVRENNIKQSLIERKKLQVHAMQKDIAAKEGQIKLLRERTTLNNDRHHQLQVSNNLRQSNIERLQQHLILLEEHESSLSRQLTIKKLEAKHRKEKIEALNKRAKSTLNEQIKQYCIMAQTKKLCQQPPQSPVENVLLASSSSEKQSFMKVNVGPEKMFCSERENMSAINSLTPDVQSSGKESYVVPEVKETKNVGYVGPEVRETESVGCVGPEVREMEKVGHAELEVRKTENEGYVRTEVRKAEEVGYARPKVRKTDKEGYLAPEVRRARKTNEGSIKTRDTNGNGIDEPEVNGTEKEIRDGGNGKRVDRNNRGRTGVGGTDIESSSRVDVKETSHGEINALKLRNWSSECDSNSEMLITADKIRNDNGGKSSVVTANSKDDSLYVSPVTPRSTAVRSPSGNFQERLQFLSDDGASVLTSHQGEEGGMFCGGSDHDDNDMDTQEIVPSNHFNVSATSASQDSQFEMLFGKNDVEKEKNNEDASFSFFRNNSGDQSTGAFGGDNGFSLFGFGRENEEESGECNVLERLFGKSDESDADEGFQPLF